MTINTLLCVWVFCAFLAAAIGREKGRPLGDSFMFGIVLGPLGVLLVAVLSAPPAPPPKGMKSMTCPRCNAVQNGPQGRR